MKRTSTAVVRALGTRETALGPTIGGAVEVEKGVLLLDTEPGNLVLGEFHDLGGMVAVVSAVGGAVTVVALGKDEDVVAAPEGVLEDGGRAEVDIGVATGRLVGGRTVEVPDPQRADVGHFLGDSLGTGVSPRCSERRAMRNSTAQGSDEL